MDVLHFHFQGAAEIERLWLGKASGCQRFCALKNHVIHLIVKQNPRGVSPVVFHVILTASLEVSVGASLYILSTRICCLL